MTMKQAGKLGIPLKIATGIYLLCSIFGFPFYISLPPVLASVGVKLPTYLLIIAAFGDNDPSTILLTQIAIACVLLLAIVVTGIIAIWKERSRLYTILVALEIVLTFILLFAQEAGVYDFTAGILVNVAYCIWIFWTVFLKNSVKDAASSFRKEN